MVSYHLDEAAFRVEVLNSPEMEAEMAAIATRGKVIAVAESPFDAGDRDGVHYNESFRVSSGTYGVIHHDRAYGLLENIDTADDIADSTAHIVEFGNHNNEAHHTVRNAMRQAAAE
jgi:hypothetical protein